MDDDPVSGRIDFVWRIESFDAESGRFEAWLEPDPDRYEWREKQGERWLYDRLENEYFSQECLDSLVEQMPTTPVYFEPPEISDVDQYLAERVPVMAAVLDGERPDAMVQDRSENVLRSLPRDDVRFVIASLDISDSTGLAVALGRETYARVVGTVLHESGELLPKFHGHVLKHTGDGLVAYLPEPNFIGKADLALRCVLIIRRLVHEALGELLRARALPAVQLHIGLDAGRALVRTVGSSETKVHHDILGAVVNMAAKIQGLAGPGDVYMGDTFVRNLHTSWRQFCEPVRLPADWPYRDARGRPYAVHRAVLAS